jgi:Regulator of chromosome condensation (RCC1) repeat
LFRFSLPERENSAEELSKASTSVYAWGHALSKPTIARFPATMQICQIACGNFHAIALSGAGQVLSWGTGYMGELGHGKGVNTLAHPTAIESFEGEPIAQLAAHGHKSAVISVGGVCLSLPHREECVVSLLRRSVAAWCCCCFLHTHVIFCFSVMCDVICVCVCVLCRHCIYGETMVCRSGTLLMWKFKWSR